MLNRPSPTIDRPAGKAPRGDTARLIVTVDTEEEGLWGDRFSPRGNTVRNVEKLDRFQKLCDQHQIRPTYLVDTPVVEDDGAVAKLVAWLDRGACEIGTHLHPWCAPPFEEQTSRHNSYLCNLPPALQRSKLQRLTDRIAQRFGRRPTSFRAGRYGLDIAGARLLEELGYVVDSSVLPFTDLSGDGGPDFRHSPYLPYYIGRDNLCSARASGSLLEVPVSVGFNRANFAWSQRLRTVGAWPVLRQLRLPGILDALGLVRRIKFTPEINSQQRLRRLIEAYAANQAPCMVLMLHSSSLAVGCSPYAQTVEDVERVYETLKAVFHFCCERQHMGNVTLTEFATAHRRNSFAGVDESSPPFHPG